jgi:hypothetical protein
MVQWGSVTAYIPQKDISSPEVMPLTLPISIAGGEVTVATNAYVVKNVRQLRLIVAKYDKAAGDFLRRFRHKPVRVYVPDMGVVFTAAVNERKNDHALFVRIPSNLKRFFMPLWQSGAMFLVLITIDAKLLQLDQETRKLTNLKDGLKQVRSQVGDAPAHQGGINRGASAGLGGQAPQTSQEG